MSDESAKVVSRLKEHAGGRPLAEERVVADHGHVGDYRRAKQLRERGLVQRKLPFGAGGDAVIHAAGQDEVPQIASPFIESRANQR